MKKIGIFYGSSSGNTEALAKKIQHLLGTENAELFEASSAKSSDLEQFENILLGTSTWGFGELEEGFDGFVPQLKAANLSGKKVALFGCGDQSSYSDTFVDGLGIVYELVAEKGCELLGKTDTAGYDYDASRAEVDGQFVGLVIDEDNQPEQTDERVNRWVNQLKNHF